MDEKGDEVIALTRNVSGRNVAEPGPMNDQDQAPQ